MYVANPVTRK